MSIQREGIWSGFPRMKKGTSMSGLITVDDLTNEEILSILDDAERMLPIARGEIHLPILAGKVLVIFSLSPPPGQECPSKLQ